MSIDQTCSFNDLIDSEDVLRYDLTSHSFISQYRCPLHHAIVTAIGNENSLAIHVMTDWTMIDDFASKIYQPFNDFQNKYIVLIYN